MEFVLEVLRGGAVLMLDYFRAHTLVCIIPAFAIAGAIETFLSRKRVLSSFSPGSSRLSNLLKASVSGSLSTVRSRDVLPVFASIYKRTRGMGPGFSFLYSGPALNVVTVALTFRILGAGMGVARIAAAFAFSLVIGMGMSFMWRSRKQPSLPRQKEFQVSEDYPDRLSRQKTAWFMVFLASVLIFSLLNHEFRDLIGIQGFWGEALSWVPAFLALISVVVTVGSWFSRRDFSRWMQESWEVAKFIIPKLAVGVFIIGMFETAIPHLWIAAAVGGNSIPANLYASAGGSLVYLAAVTEVPLTNTLIRMGMGWGPGLALLLAGPALSINRMITLGKHLGWGKTIIYVILVILAATASGWVFGLLASTLLPRPFSI